MNGNLDPQYIAVIIVSLIISLSVHEFMHAFVGHRLGDTTAEEEGRLTLNPLRHIDPLMTLVLPVVTILLAGTPILAAKPVPFNPHRIKYDEYGAAMLAAAGPLANLALAIIGALLSRLLTDNSVFLAGALTVFVTLNVALFVFNLLPIPPLDGSRVLYAFAPEPVQKFMRDIEPYGFVILIVLIFAGILGGLLGSVDNFVLNQLP